MEFYDSAVGQCEFFRDERSTQCRLRKLIELVAGEPGKNAALTDTTAADCNQFHLRDAIVILVHSRLLYLLAES